MMNARTEPLSAIRSVCRNSLVALGLALGGLLEMGSAVAQPLSKPKPDWSVADIPSQTGRIFLVTGGTSGMGYEDAKALAGAGAQVVIAARNPERGQEAIARIKQEVPDAQVQFEAVDLADLASVKALSERLNATLPRLDGLINNAAIMAPPQRTTSADGFEAQLATNYLGHFALAAQVLPLLRKSDAPRIVTLASIAVARGSINFDDLQYEQAYNPYAAYAQSKLAGLIWAFELQRRSEAAGWGIQSIAAHPGVAVTELVKRGPGLESEFGRQWAKDREVYHSAAQGALPTLYAATAAEAQGGAYYGPIGDEEKRGPLGLATVPAAAQDTEAAARLWTVSEQLTGVRFQ
ncbi:MAG: oxidoreductase [Pseudomonas sp.]|uniref:oxidoreductase n=1 Tax=Pseudomonas sp. TaxID=306 RepID=UPI003D110526